MLLSTELEGVKDFMPNSNHFHWNGYRTELTIQEHLYTCGLFIKKKRVFSKRGYPASVFQAGHHRA